MACVWSPFLTGFTACCVTCEQLSVFLTKRWVGKEYEKKYVNKLTFYLYFDFGWTPNQAMSVMPYLWERTPWVCECGLLILQCLEVALVCRQWFQMESLSHSFLHLSQTPFLHTFFEAVASNRAVLLTPQSPPRSPSAAPLLTSVHLSLSSPPFRQRCKTSPSSIMCVLTQHMLKINL